MSYFVDYAYDKRSYEAMWLLVYGPPLLLMYDYSYEYNIKSKTIYYIVFDFLLCPNNLYVRALFPDGSYKLLKSTA